MKMNSRYHDYVEKIAQDVVAMSVYLDPKVIYMIIVIIFGTF